MQAVIEPDMVDSNCESEDVETTGAPNTAPGMDDPPSLDRIVGSRPDADFMKKTLRAQVYHYTLFAYDHCLQPNVTTCTMSRRLKRRKVVAGGQLRVVRLDRREKVAGEQHLVFVFLSESPETRKASRKGSDG